MIIFFSIIITALLYLAYPLYHKSKHGKTSPNKAGEIALINSIVIGLIFMIISISIFDTPSAGLSTAFLYYFIAKSILQDKNYTDKNNADNT